MRALAKKPKTTGDTTPPLQRTAGTGRARAGTPLPPEVRGFFEPRFRTDFANVRVHDDGAADARARRMGAVAYTVGSHIHFAAGRYQPSTAAGRWVLAHELAHVIQQGRSSLPRDETLSDREHAAEEQAHLAAAAVVMGGRAPAIAPDGRGARTLALSETAFRTGLGSTPEQEAAISALFSNAEFIALWDYLRTCTAAPTQDLGPLALAVTPGLSIGGTVRFGGYDPGSRTLEINPTKPEHVNNPSELVDTITHELIHAEFDLESPCAAAGSGPAPLGGAATISPPSRASLAAMGSAGTARDAALTASIGPGASDPCGEFLDENAAAQQIIARIIQSNITLTHVGHPTLTFVNLIIRGDPAALSFYTACRATACATPAGPARVAAITDCSQRTIATFIPPAMTPALLPTRVDFDPNSHVLRADARETLHLVALFLTSHPGTRVNLTGRTDASGSAAANLAVGQARANAVKTFLLGEGVPATQIGTVTSTGETGSSHSGRAGFAERSVEIAP